MYNHSSVTKSFKDMRLHHHFRMRPCGVDVKRCHQLLTSLDIQGKARIEDAKGELIEVQINEDLIAEALKLPKGTQLLPKRGSTQEVKATFQMRGQDRNIHLRISLRRRWSYPSSYLHSNSSMGKRYDTRNCTEQWQELSA